MHPSTISRITRVLPAVEWLGETTSTNAVAVRRAGDGAASGLLVLADVQTAGRGRRDRSWHAPAGTSVLASLLWRPHLPRSLWPRFSLAAGLALDDVARAHLSAGRVALKWPNDLLVDGVKCAGVLLESTVDAVVVGVGLNVDWTDVARPDGLRATSLAEAAGRAIDRDDVIVALAEALHRRMTRADGDPDGAVQDYIPRCGTLSTQVTAHGAAGHGRTVRGTAVGLTPDGHLRIRVGDDREVVVSSADVEHLR